MKTQIVKLKIVYDENTENPPSLWDWRTILDLQYDPELLDYEDVENDPELIQDED